MNNKRLIQLRKRLRKECPPDHWIWKIESIFKNKAFRMEIRGLMHQYFLLKNLDRFHLEITPMNRDRTVIRIKEWIE